MKQAVGWNKVLSLDDVAKISRDLRKKGKVVVHCHGVFDLIHLGHIRHLNSAKREGDVLVVTITADKYVKRGPGRPLFNENLRAESLASLELVDYVAVINEPTALKCISKIKPGAYVKGPDYKEKGKDVTGMISAEGKAVESYGGRLVITDDITFSSSNLINNNLDVYPSSTRRYLRALGKKYTAQDIVNYLDEVKKLKVLIVGDAIIDQYEYCGQMGRAGKEPLVVNRYLEGEMFVGGAINTANHASSLVDRVDLLTMLGRKDSKLEFIKNSLASGVKPKFFYRNGAETTLKRRYVSNVLNRKLFEIYFMKDEMVDVKTEESMLDYLKTNIGKYDVVIVNDFGHGLITDRMIKLICSKARKLAINVQTNGANTGFNLVTKYPKANLVCVDEMELRYATHDRFSSLRKIVKRIGVDMKADMVVTTRGNEGSLMYLDRAKWLESPALASKVVDSMGAGDAFFSFIAPCYAAGMPPDLIAFIGNVVGSLAVQVVGHREVVQKVDVVKFITRLLK